MPRLSRQRAVPAFTLIELLVVIAILSLLFLMSAAQLGTARMRARDAKRLSDLKAINLALHQHMDAKGYYPGVHAYQESLSSNQYKPCHVVGAGSLPDTVRLWNCNGYQSSYDPDHWQGQLGQDLAPYLPQLPVDPINSKCDSYGTTDGTPSRTPCYSYSYGNVSRTDAPAFTFKPEVSNSTPQYDLFTRLEDPYSPYRCSLHHYKYWLYPPDAPVKTATTDTTFAYDWCGKPGYYSDQMYEASPL